MVRNLRTFDKRSKFKTLSFDNKFTCNMGNLLPVYCEDILPGDEFKITPTVVARMMPLLAPMMHKVDVRMHFFFVPLRLIFKDWETFITGGKNNDGKTIADDTVVAPYMVSPSGGYAVGSLGDYLGYPTVDTDSPISGTYNHSALKFRAYNRIYNDFWLPQNLKDPVAFTSDNGLDTTTNTTLLPSNWQHDFFTDLMPSPQRGDPMSIPVATEAPITFSAKDHPTTIYDSVSGNKMSVRYPLAVNTDGYQVGFANNADTNALAVNNSASLKADLSSAASVTIESLSTAIALQQYAYLSARIGFRYVEYLRGVFGVTPSDARLQRAEYIGGFKFPFMISEVLQTSETSSTPQGNMSGHGVTAASKTISKAFNEHGILMGLMSIVPRTGYFQGLKFSDMRESRYDYYNPVYAHLGNRLVKNKEILLTGESTDDQGFGYHPIYEEYRRHYSECHGQFRTSLRYWHLDRYFTSDSIPTLSSSFVECHPSKRVFAVSSDDVDSILCNIHFDVFAKRPVSKYGDPQFASWMT